MKGPGPFRDGTIHILDEKCSTCVFRPGNLMHLSQGRLQDLVETNRAADTAFACHQTLPHNNEYDAPPAVCRGYFDAYGSEVTPLRMATAMGLITEDPQPEKKEVSK